MAIVYAVKSGNWSDITVWNTGSLPTAADDVRSNGFIVTVDGSYSVNSVSNKSESGVSAGGYFDLTNGVTLTSTNGFTGGASVSSGTIGAVRFNLPLGQSATLVGNLNPGTNSGFYALSMNNSGTLNIVGSAILGTISVFYVVGSISGGIVNMTGSLSGTAGGHIFNMNSAITLNLTGNINQVLLSLGSHAHIINIVGNVAASSIQHAITGTNANSVVTITGNITDVNGYRAVATAGKLFLPNTGMTYTVSKNQAGDTMQLSTNPNPATGGYPAPASVKYGVTYGSLSEFTGTCRVPEVQSVAYGVPVGDGYGTAALRMSDIITALTVTMR